MTRRLPPPSFLNWILPRRNSPFSCTVIGCDVSVGTSVTGPGPEYWRVGGLVPWSYTVTPPGTAAIWYVTFGAAMPTTAFPAASFTTMKPPGERTLLSHVSMNGWPHDAEPLDDGADSSTRIGPRAFVFASTTVSRA